MRASCHVRTGDDGKTSPEDSNQASTNGYILDFVKMYVKTTLKNHESYADVASKDPDTLSNHLQIYS